MVAIYRACIIRATVSFLMHACIHELSVFVAVVVCMHVIYMTCIWWGKTLRFKVHTY